MANGQEVEEELDPRVATIVARARKAYLGLKAVSEPAYSWEELRPRLIRRLNYDFGIVEREE